MNLLRKIKTWCDSKKAQPLEKWFFVEINADSVKIKASPPGKDSWEQKFDWDTIKKVCFKDEGIWASDVFYVFTTIRQEAFVVPVEANGGHEFWKELEKRGLFPENISTKAIRSTDGGLYCWPLENKELF